MYNIYILILLLSLFTLKKSIILVLNNILQDHKH